AIHASVRHAAPPLTAPAGPPVLTPPPSEGALCRVRHSRPLVALTPGGTRSAAWAPVPAPDTRRRPLPPPHPPPPPPPPPPASTRPGVQLFTAPQSHTAPAAVTGSGSASPSPRPLGGSDSRTSHVSPSGFP